MPQRDLERYTLGDDGLIVEKVGSWAVDKLKLVTDYVYISGAPRKGFLDTGAAYIDPFCGAGRSLIKDTTTFIDGSPVAAFKRAIESPGRFTSIAISDGDDVLLAAATQRLTALSAPVRSFAGPASESMPKIVQSLDRHGLHLAFLDPYNLGALSFDLFEQLAKLRHIDVIAHVSVSDLQRNADRYTDRAYEQFDRFAPGWRRQVNPDVNLTAFRAAILRYWSERISALGLPQAKHRELIRGGQGQRLYWLILLSRHQLAHKFWEKVSSAARSPMFDGF
ncbi:three-Cys-motif partner protein TcmP [Rhodoplanes serenus]|uniref:Three-Cys-motif partner protein TcmP n=1 Tax=Rhodoplanes serenus TaxID=200615 RepID=A0A9X4XPL6_9BRAD|nr:three-Cys-motif partner protein TcmP [Rhodoplanes serenus]MTW18960.1 three-Cys-motif partner protein TcmP [Rhodoplanes serenus]